MAFKDILLPLVNYPDPMPLAAVDQSVWLCRLLGEGVCAVTNHVRFPLKSNWLANTMIGLSDLAREEEQRSVDQARTVLARFHAKASEAGIAPSQLMLRSELYNVGDQVAQAARTRDLCVIAFNSRADGQRVTAEAAIFGSGRPVIVFEASDVHEQPARPARILIAWDGERAAARAVADAMPILTGATEVQILAVVNEKPATVAGAGVDLQRHLASHGVAANVREIDAEGAEIGTVLRRHLAQDDWDLLVMGAFGHSRVREFILGGATRDLLDRPPVPIFFAH